MTANLLNALLVTLAFGVTYGLPAVLAAAWLWRRRPPSAAARREAGLLAVILALAYGVRLLHPLRHAYLGQSDAYTHLLFIKDILADGTIRHPAYPAGYHWIVALPVRLFRLDPYLAARYGGAFFGTMLCLGLYGLLRAGGRAFPALLGAFLAASCPVFGILIKTGVGAFANQVGLALTPVILLAYSRFVARARGGGAVLTALLAGLAACVPLMLLRLGVVMLAERALALAAAAGGGGRAAWRRTGRLALLLLPAALIVALQFAPAGSAWWRVTGEALTGERLRAAATPQPGPVQAEPARTAPCPAAAVARDYLSVKRAGLGSRWMTLAACGLLALFAAGAVQGARRRMPLWRVIGVFGCVTGLQTLTGVLEFSRYQRAGWSFMIAAVCACAWLGFEVYRRIRPAGLRRGLVAAGAAACVTLTLLHPPGHLNAVSSAEDALVRLTRALAHREAVRAGVRVPVACDAPLPAAVAAALEPGLPAVLVVRSTSGAATRGFWELPDAVTVRGAPLEIVNVRQEADLRAAFRPGRQLVVFLDRARRIAAPALGSVAALDPAQAERYARWQYGHYAVNGVIRDFLDALPEDAWRRRAVPLGARATVVVAVPRAGSGAAPPGGTPRRPRSAPPPP
ncbi:MAG: hypothetical protein JW951_08925 [Lentisphaerae bacterium]|nr:hypothetical protein [Lentisphaerota bacterium]